MPITARILFSLMAVAFVVWAVLMITATASAQDITTWATPVPETPTPDMIDALVSQIVAILRQIIADIIRGVLEPVAVVIGR